MSDMERYLDFMASDGAEITDEQHQAILMYEHHMQGWKRKKREEHRKHSTTWHVGDARCAHGYP